MKPLCEVPINEHSSVVAQTGSWPESIHNGSACSGGRLLSSDFWLPKFQGILKDGPQGKRFRFYPHRRGDFSCRFGALGPLPIMTTLLVLETDYVWVSPCQESDSWAAEKHGSCFISAMCIFTRRLLQVIFTRRLLQVGDCRQFCGISGAKRPSWNPMKGTGLAARTLIKSTLHERLRPLRDHVKPLDTLT